MCQNRHANDGTAPDDADAETPFTQDEGAEHDAQSAEADQDARRSQLKAAAMASLRKMNGQFFRGA